MDFRSRIATTVYGDDGALFWGLNKDRVVSTDFFCFKIITGLVPNLLDHQRPFDQLKIEICALLYGRFT